MSVWRAAILVDAAFFLKRFKTVYPGLDQSDPLLVADTLYKMCLSHLTQKRGRDIDERADLHRILIYDCPPFAGKSMNPVSKQQIDFGRTAVNSFRTTFHTALRGKRLVALRLGEPYWASGNPWVLRGAKLKALLNGKLQIGDLQPRDVEPDIKQKGVDIKIGVDIAALALKGHVQQIVLVSGDSDFVPAAKLARREGVDFVLDPMWNPIRPDLHEHIDGLISKCPKPKTH